MARSLDDLQDERYLASPLHGDGGVEADSRMPVRALRLETLDWASVPLAQSRPSIMSLAGTWLMISCPPPDHASEQSLVDRRNPLAHSKGVLAGWADPDVDRSDWIPAQVPGTVQGALRAAGLIDDPFWDTNTIDELENFGTPKTASWHFRKTRIEQQEWWFARTFDVPREWDEGNLELYFDGLDYAASIYLNGQPLGHHVGMFGGPELDVSGLVLRDRANTLVIRFMPPPHHWYGVLKASPGWGWHYGHMISIGPWRDVVVRQVPVARVANVTISTASLSDVRAEIDVDFDVVCRTAEGGRASIDLCIRPDAGSGDAIRLVGERDLVYGTNRFRTRVSILEPSIWWPRGYGKQPLYRATVGVTHSGARHTETRIFGIRTIEMRPIDGLDGDDFYRWRFVINSRPLYIKGANWCWTDPYLATPFPRRMLELTLRANVQMLRAWGGGLIESDQFYDFCDRAGILVYQEFPLSFGPNDSPVTDLGVIDRQAQRIVQRLRHHPSLVMWGGGNENETARGFDEPLFLLGKRCRQYDSSRPYHRTDPWGGSVHNYDVFHMGRPMDSGYANLPAVMYGEFGTPSMPSRPNVAKFLPSSALDHWPPSIHDRGVISHMHQFTILDFVKILRYADYGPVRDWDTFIRYGQLAQADALRFAAERQRASPESTAGFWFYKMTELFPGASWGVIDFHGAPKPAYYRARRFCRPRHAFATYARFEWRPGERFRAEVHFSNDTPARCGAGSVRVWIFDRSLAVVVDRAFRHAEIAADSTVQVGTVETVVTDGMAPFFLSVARAEDDAGVPGSWYWFNVRQKTDRVRQLESGYIRRFPVSRVPEAFAAYAEAPRSRLDALPQTDLTFAAISNDDGACWQLQITNDGPVPAFDVTIGDGGDGVAGFLSDNNFCVHSGESIRLTAELGASQSIGAFVARGWNFGETPVIVRAR